MITFYPHPELANKLIAETNLAFKHTDLPMGLQLFCIEEAALKEQTNNIAMMREFENYLGMHTVCKLTWESEIDVTQVYM